MGLLYVLLVTVAALLASSNVGTSAATETGQSKISTLALPESPLSAHSIIARQRRSLRTDKPTETEDDDSEARGVWKYVKVRWWAETDMTDDYVKEALKLKGFTGNTLTSHKNFKYYQYFVKKSEDYLMNKWLTKGITTFEAWEKLGFKGITTNELQNIVRFKNYRVYERYVNAFDTNVKRLIIAGYNPPAVMISREATKAEMRARTLIMARAGREEKYAQLLLGLTEVSKPKMLLKGSELTTHKDYKYFKLFQEEVKNNIKKTN